MNRLLLSAAIVLALSGRASGATVPVAVVPGAPGLPVPSSGHVLVFPESTPATRTAFSGSTDPVVVEIPAGAVAISADVPGMWCDRRAVPEGADAAPVLVPCWPAGSIRGRVAFAEKGKEAAELTVRFQSAPGGPAAGLPATGTASARIEAGGWEAKVPVGLLDLSLRIPGFIPHYLWGVAIESGKPADAGPRTFRTGSSLIGTVEGGRSARLKPEECLIRLRPLVEAGRGKDAGRSTLLARTIRPTSRGFFQFEGVGPGRWELVATQPGLAEATRLVDLVEGMESAMNAPLVLAPFASLELVVDPPRDAEGESWGIDVAEMRPGAGAQRVIESRARSDGTWRFDRMVEGRSYVVILKTAAGVGWWADPEPFEMGPGTQRRTISTGVERVHGIVRLGKKPLAAVVTFGEEGHATGIRFESDATGQFDGALPRRGAYRATVRSEAPAVRRTVDVEVPAPGDDGIADLEIHLPESALQGEIVDEGGNLVPKASLSIRALSRRESIVEPVPDGKFLLGGLLDGDYLATADATDLESDTYSFRISRGEEPEPLRIVLHPLRTIRGRTVNGAGSGIPRSSVQRLPEPLAESGGRAFPAADLEGRWSARTLAMREAACLLLASPGFSARVLAMKADPAEQEVVLDQAGGRLVLRMKETTYGDPFPVLFHGGCLCYARALFGYGVGELTEEKGGLRIVGALEAGEYSLCMLTHEEFRAYAGGRPAFPACAHGILKPFSSLELTAPER